MPFPSPGDLPDPGIEFRSPALRADALLSEPPGKFLVETLKLLLKTFDHPHPPFPFSGSKGMVFLEEEMGTHSSILAWRIPWRGEPGRLLSMGLQRVGHNLATTQRDGVTHKRAFQVA